MSAVRAPPDPKRRVAENAGAAKLPYLAVGGEIDGQVVVPLFGEEQLGIVRRRRGTADTANRSRRRIDQQLVTRHADAGAEDIDRGGQLRQMG